jgi:hypothetical protein
MIWPLGRDHRRVILGVGVVVTILTAVVLVVTFLDLF